MVENAIGEDDAAPSNVLSTKELWEDGRRVAFDKSSSQNENEIEWDDGEVVIEDNLDLVN